MPANNYPTVINGQPVDATTWFNPVAQDLTALAAAFAPTTAAIKTADQTVNNSATLVNDSVLLAAVAANSTYRFELGVRYNSNSTADINTGWAVPSGTIMAFDIIGVASGASATTIRAWDSNTNFAFEGAGGVTSFRESGLIVTSSTAGTVQFKWAQNTANVSNTMVTAQSYLLLTKIA